MPRGIWTNPSRTWPPFISFNGRELVTDSRAVAQAFWKRHKNVLRAIDAMRACKHPEIAEHAGLNFEPGSYADAQGQMRAMYRMTVKSLWQRLSRAGPCGGADAEWAAGQQ